MQFLSHLECGISEFAHEFMANMVLPDGQSTAAYMMPQIEAAYQSGKMPEVLPWGSQTK